MVALGSQGRVPGAGRAREARAGRRVCVEGTERGCRGPSPSQRLPPVTALAQQWRDRAQPYLLSLQVLRILEKRGPRVAPGAADDLSAVRNNTHQMATLLAEERPRAETAMGPILEFAVSEDVLEHLLGWHLQRDVPEERKVELLKLFEMLISQAHQPLLRHEAVLAPLLRLLGLCAAPASPLLESSLVLLLNQLCVSVARDPPLLERFFHSPAEQAPPDLLLFSLLVPFVHHEGVVGQQARDALLLLMAMSAGSHTVARYITEHSYFCPVRRAGVALPSRRSPAGFPLPAEGRCWCPLPRWFGWHPGVFRSLSWFL